MIKTIGFGLLLLFCSLRAFCIADDNIDFSPLQLNVLVNEVVRRNPNLDATRLRIQAAHEAVHRVQVLDDPRIMITSDQNKFHKTSDFTPMLDYEISQMIPFPGKLHLKGEIAKQVMLQQQSIEITTYRELIRQTKLLYYQLYTNAVSRRINTDNSRLVSALIEDSMALYRSGKGEYVDTIKMQLELQMLEEQRLMLESEKVMFKSMLNALLNRSPNEALGDPIASFTKPFQLSYIQAESIALTSRSELHRMQAMVMEQEKMAQLARRNYYPNFEVGVTYERMNNNFDGHVDDAIMFKIGFNLPIWIPEKQAREVREARANAFANQKELKGMKAMIFNGQVEPLTAERKQKILDANSSLASQALRVLAVGYRPLPQDAKIDQSVEDKLILVGLISMMDPPRPEVKKSI